MGRTKLSMVNSTSFSAQHPPLSQNSTEESNVLNDFSSRNLSLGATCNLHVRGYLENVDFTKRELKRP